MRNHAATDFIVNTVDDLERLHAHQQAIVIRLRVAALSAAESVAWERRLNSLHNACGCDTATAFFLIGGVLSGLATYLVWPLARQHLLSWSAAAVLFCAVSVAAGKAVGRARARSKFRCAIRDLRATLQKLTASYSAAA